MRHRIGYTRATKKTCEAVSQIKNHGGQEFQVRECLIEYAKKLLSKHLLSGDFLQFILTILPNKSLTRFLELITKHHKEEKDIREWASDSNWGYVITSDLNKSLISLKENEIKKFLLGLLQEEKLSSKNIKEIIFTQEMKYVKKLFELSNEEIKIIAFYYCYSQSDGLSNLYDSYRILSDKLKGLALSTGIPITRVKELLSSNNKLFQHGILNKSGEGCYCFHSLDESLTDYLTGLNDTSFADRYCLRDKNPVYNIRSFDLAEDCINIMVTLLSSNRPCNILIYGEPGTGKTEFARSIVRFCKKSIYFARHEVKDHSNNKKLAIRVAVKTINQIKGILIVDEADLLINTEYIFFENKQPWEKSWLNNLLDNSKAKIIWISNDINYVNRSALRRFNYSIHFKDFTRKQRENILLHAIKKHPLKKYFTRELIRTISTDFQVNASSIASVLNTLQETLPDEKVDGSVIARYIGELLKNQQELIHGKRKNVLDLNRDYYDITVLNVDIKIDQLLYSLERFVEWDREDTQSKSCNINLLFCGKPGTGKTEFAKYLSFKLGKELMIKRASDLLSCWVGETEKNIRNAFEKTERENAILLLDEADSLFINRENALRSWEVSQTNELLTQMENYRGILICCTNLLKTIDPASLRRFHWKIEFKPLTNEGKLRVYKKYFSVAGKELNTSSKKRLMAINDLTLGDVRTVWQRHRFIPEKELSNEILITALEQEASFKESKNNIKIGFIKS